jgi:diguanylate cyclase (GGDEF)-like protein
MDTKHLDGLQDNLEGIRQLLSHLHGEISTLEVQYRQVLRVLEYERENGRRDDLTGVNRRASFFEGWESLIGRSAEARADLGLILIDIDHFKRINDVYGHPAGDEVLRRVGEVLAGFETGGCVAGRMGGEEFALAVGLDGVLVPSLFEAAERIRIALSGVRLPDGTGITVSVGTAVAGFEALASGDPSGLQQRLYEKADQALYRAKNSGRNRVVEAA